MFVFIKYSHNTVIKLCNEVIEKCDALESLIANDSWTDSYRDSVKLMNDIDNSFSFVSVYMNHQDVDLLHNETLKLSQYTKFENKSEALASVHIIKHSADSIKELQNINIKNLF